MKGSGIVVACTLNLLFSFSLSVVVFRFGQHVMRMKELDAFDLKFLGQDFEGLGIRVTFT